MNELEDREIFVNEAEVAAINYDNPGDIKYNPIDNTFETIGCPCCYSKPCNPRCTCNDEYSSFGCLNCESYGQKTMVSGRR